MTRLLRTPNLPDAPVCHGLIARSFFSLLAEPLARYGVQALPAPVTHTLPSAIRDHADMNCRHLGGDTLVVFQNAVVPHELSRIGLRIIPSDRPGGGQYPLDAALNVLLLSGYAFHKAGITDPCLQKLLSARGYTLKAVPQGYTACSSAIVNEHALITADTKIAQAAETVGIDVLQIQPGFIDLPGYSYGFLGGACGKIAPNCLAFTGQLNHHPDHHRILSFLSAHHVEPVFLTDRPCFDCGGILPITQQ